MATGVVMEDFPVHALLPKRETQIESFLRKYPHYDGSDTLIAIFDSGIDPGAPGLSVTPSGQRKIINLIDCSGSGDVDTSTVVFAKEGTIDAITGRKLKVPESWNNPSGQYYVGSKRLYSLFPRTLLNRVKKERKEDFWEPAHRAALAEATRNLCEWEEKLKDKIDKTDKEELDNENYKNTVDALQQIDDKYDDCGPVYDCVVFHDGERWRVCIDTTEEGDLEKCQLLHPFKESGEYARFSDKDMVNYAVDVLDEGKLLSIITNSSSHGTHVASIAAAYFPENPELNGVAAGAQIISMQIGDNRISGMETGTALMRAMKCAIECGVDVINLSYGESSKWANSGRVVDMINKLVTEHNIIFISSAGNNGPALSTVGSPGGTSQHVIGVGAYISPDMMAADYSLLEKCPGNQYTWSSVGPSSDGDLGVCITAPGGAITSVPNWTLSNSQLMNGTSMSSPNACGGIAVLLSALKKEGIVYSPRTIRRCLENTALRIEGLSTLVQGYGLLQVEKAYEYMREINNEEHAQFISYDVTYESYRGIYVRELEQHNLPDKFNISISPNFHKKTSNDLKIKYDLNLCLVSTEPWVTCPTHLKLCNSMRHIAVVIKKDGLKPGVHYAEVHGFDSQSLNLGPVFRVPITVVIPENKNHKNWLKTVEPEKLSFKSGTRIRKFYFVPQGATWAELKICSTEKDRDIRYVVHAVQLGAESAFIENEFQRFETIKASTEETEFAFAVQGGYTLEVCIARWWSVAGDSELSYEISFHGLLPDSSHVFLDGNSAFARVDVTNELGLEEIQPHVKVTHHVLSVVPKSSTLKPLGPRDLLPDGEQIYSLEMTYNFNLTKASELIPVVPQLHDLLYESKYESQFWMCYDNNKYLVRSGDAFPLKYNYACKLEKGDHFLRLQVRHSDPVALNGLKDMAVNLHIKIATPFQLDVYGSRHDLLNKKKKFSKRVLTSQSKCPVYIAYPPEDKIPKGVRSWHKLIGTLQYASTSMMWTKGKFPLTIRIAEPKAIPDVTKKKEEKQIEEQYKNAYQEFLAQWTGKLQGSSLEEEVLNEIDETIASQNALLNALDGAKNRLESLHKIISTAKKVIDQVDDVMLLSYFAAKQHIDTEDQKKKEYVCMSPERFEYLLSLVGPIITKKQAEDMEKQKTILVNALYKMGVAVADGLLGISKNKNTTKDDGPEETVGFSVKDLNSCYRMLAKFVDKKDAKMQILTVLHGMVHKHFGRALLALLKYFEENAYTKEYFNIFIDLSESLGYQHMVEYYKRWQLVRFPAAYELF